ncbi:MAG: hypothetical protein AAF654_10150 [Myxococcota bacterium]
MINERWMGVFAASLVFACNDSSLDLPENPPAGGSEVSVGTPGPGSGASNSGGGTTTPNDPPAPDPTSNPPCLADECNDSPPAGDDCPDDPQLTEVVPPTVSLTFPTAESSTNGTAITARGTANAGCGTVITSMSALVGDTEFDLFVTPGSEVDWTFDTNLALGRQNAIEIRATDSGALEGGTEFTVTQEPHPSPPIDHARGIVLQSSSQTVFVVDRHLDRIIAIDRLSGARSVFSGPGVGAGPELRQPDGGIDLDEARNQLVVTDRGLDAIIGVDLSTGERRIISDNSIADVEISTPTGIIVDGPSGIAYYVDSSLDGVVRVDLLTGRRFVVSDGAVPADPQPIDLSTPVDVAIDAGRNRLLVADVGKDALVEVNLIDGSRRSLVETNSNVLLDRPRGVLVDGDRALVLDNGVGGIVSIDLISGDRTILSDSDKSTGPRLGNARDLALDEASGTVLVADTGYFYPLVVEIAGTGARMPLTETALPEVGHGPKFTNPSGLVRHPTTSQIYLTDLDTGRILSLDVPSGERRAVLGAAAIEPDGLGFDVANERFIVLNQFENDVLSVDFAGEISVVSNADSPLLGSSTGFGFIEGQVAVEPGGASILVADRAHNVLHRVELATGAREYFVDEYSLIGVRSVVVDEVANRAIVATGDRFNDSVRDAVIAYDLTTGAATSLASSPPGVLHAGSGVDLVYPVSLALDPPRNAVLVFDAELDAILSIDLATLERSVLVDATTGNGDHLSRAANGRNAMVLDTERRLVYAANNEVGEVVMVDLQTGDQVVIAR